MKGLLEEIDKISVIISEKFQKRIDGKESILWMKKNGTNWRQMEWMGFYFEEFLFTMLKDNLGGGKGPTFGRTTIDYKNDFIWDFKTHSEFDSKGKKVTWTVMNDKEAIEKCIEKFGGIGFVIAEVNPQFDHNLSFKKWHDEFKGKKTAYVIKREKEGASSRIRKVSVEINRIFFVYFNSQKDIDRGYNEGWLSNFQEGMRNSNDNSRRVKIMVNLDTLPNQFILKEMRI